MSATKIKVSEKFGFTYDFATNGAQASYLLPVYIPAGCVVPVIKILVGLDLVSAGASTISFGINGYAADTLLTATLHTAFTRDGAAVVGEVGNIFTGGQMTMTIGVADITAGIIYVAVPITTFVF